MKIVRPILLYIFISLLIMVVYVAAGMVISPIIIFSANIFASGLRETGPSDFSYITSFIMTVVTFCGFYVILYFQIDRSERYFVMFQKEYEQDKQMPDRKLTHYLNLINMHKNGYDEVIAYIIYQIPLFFILSTKMIELKQFISIFYLPSALLTEYISDPIIVIIINILSFYIIFSCIIYKTQKDRIHEKNVAKHLSK